MVDLRAVLKILNRIEAPTDIPVERKEVTIKAEGWTFDLAYYAGKYDTINRITDPKGNTFEVWDLHDLDHIRNWGG